MSMETGAWEDNGGACAARKLHGSTAQVEWADRIRALVGAEFDRVAAAFHAVEQKQNPGRRTSTTAVIAIMEDTRAQVMRNESAGYVIHDWQEISDQVRQMIFSDPRYQAIRSKRGRGPLPTRGGSE